MAFRNATKTEVIIDFRFAVGSPLEVLAICCHHDMLVFCQYTQIRSSYFSQNMLLFDGFVGSYFQNLQDFFTGNHYDCTHRCTMMNLECKDCYFEQVTSVRSQHTRPCAQLWIELCRVGSELSVAGRVVCRIVTPTSRVYCHQTSSNQQIDLGKPANHQIRNVASPVSSLCQVGKRGFSASTWGLSLSGCCCDTKRCEFAARTRAKKNRWTYDDLWISLRFLQTSMIGTLCHPSSQ